MPYIKKEDRPRYDNIITRGERQGLVIARELLFHDLRDSHPTQVDGYLNYYLTKLLKDLKEDPGFFFKQFIREVLQEVYCTPPKYYKLERGIGLLTCMIIEFSRRKWSKVSKKLLKDIRREFTETLFIPYEMAKRSINGDI